MKDPWHIRIWGVRGSIPMPSAEFLGYGGNTACISVDCGGALVSLDAGSGLTALGERMAQEKRRRVDILITHIHLDHIMGLFSFAPRHDPAVEIHLYGMPGLAQALAHLIGPPLWPVDLAGNRGQVHIHEVWNGKPFPLADGAAPGLTVTAMEGSHPGGCVYYRLEGEGRSLVYALDCELEGGMAPRLAAFAQGTDLLIWDANFAPGDLKQGWGHSTWEQGIALRREAGAKQVLMTHYNQLYTDEFIQKQEMTAVQSDAACQFAREGMVLQL